MFKSRKYLLLAAAVVLTAVAIFLIFNDQAIDFIGSGGKFGSSGATGSW